MKIYTVLCTRDKKFPKITHDLLKYFLSCKIDVTIIPGATSIFLAYSSFVKSLKNEPNNSAIIFCHDDIAIQDDPKDFTKKITETLEEDNTGFIGVAGTTFLSENAVWWDWNIHQMGKHRGKVRHITENGKPYVTHYGEPGNVAVLDGLFLAANLGTLRKINLHRPDNFSGLWDFYDIYYTSQTNEQGFDNKVIDVDITHMSRGELVGRDSWYANQKAFIEMNKFPITC